ncbi:nicotinate-nucleotide pyrophosphorylase [Microbacterium testaceum]|nr:nicotinate-nucleotide pyrophosphorylase [Microbacterium testaceum]
MLTRAAIERVVSAALTEDAPWGDLTSETLIPADAVARAALVARVDGVFSGAAVFAAAFTLTDPSIVVEQHVADGERFAPGDTLATVSGPARAVLTAERIGLNFVQRMSGIATLTSRVRRRSRAHRCTHRRHAQDHTGPSRDRAPGSA